MAYLRQIPAFLAVTAFVGVVACALTALSTIGGAS